MKVLQDYLMVAGVSQADLARRAGIDPSVLNHFLKGKREPRIANLRKLAKATGISVDKLVEACK